MVEFSADDMMKAANGWKPPQASSDDSDWGDVTKDVALSAVIGVPKGMISAVGAPGDIGSLASKATDFIGDAFGASPESVQDFKSKYKTAATYNPLLAPFAQGPTSQDVRKGVETVTGPLYDPKTGPGHMAQTVSEFVSNPLSYLGPGSLGVKAAVAGGAGVGAEGSGQLVESLMGEGVPAEAARVIGGIAGGLGTAGALSLARGLANWFGRPYRKLPDTEFDIPATRGMIENDPIQIAEEQAMQNGARGRFAQGVMERARVQREGALENERGRMLGEFGEPAATPAEAADTVQYGLRNKAEELRSTGNALYESAKAKNPWAVADDFKPTIFIDDALANSKDGPLSLDRYGNTPVSQRAYNLIGRLQGGVTQEAGEQHRLLSLKEMAEVRQRLAAMKANPLQHEDGLILSHIKRAYDDWQKGVIDNALFVGDKTAIDDIRRATPIWRRYRQMTDGDPKQDHMKVIADIVGKDRSPEEVANWLLNVTSLGQAGRASRVARYIQKAMGPDSEEFKALQQALLYRGLGDKAKTGNELANQLRRITDGAGAPLARVLWGPEMTARARQLEADLRRTHPPLFNPPRSGYETSKYMRSVVQSLAAAMGIEGVLHSGQWRWIGLAAIPFVKDVLDARRAVHAVRETKPHINVTRRGVMSGALPQLGGEQP